MIVQVLVFGLLQGERSGGTRLEMLAFFQEAYTCWGENTYCRGGDTMRIPKHVGIIPDGNRRWAKQAGLAKQEGYAHGLVPGVELLHLAREAGVQELTFYGFTTDNCGRPLEQVQAFSRACVEAVERVALEPISLLVVGDKDAPAFPKELLPYTVRLLAGKATGNADLAQCYEVAPDHFLVRLKERHNYVYSPAHAQAITPEKGLAPAFYRAVKSGDLESARRMMTKELSDAVDDESLAAFFAPYSDIVENRFSDLSGGFFLINKNTLKGEPFSFEVSGERISDITQD